MLNHSVYAREHFCRFVKRPSSLQIYVKPERKHALARARKRPQDGERGHRGQRFRSGRAAAYPIAPSRRRRIETAGRGPPSRARGNDHEMVNAAPFPSKFKERSRSANSKIQRRLFHPGYERTAFVSFGHQRCFARGCILVSASATDFTSSSTTSPRTKLRRSATSSSNIRESGFTSRPRTRPGSTRSNSGSPGSNATLSRAASLPRFPTWLANSAATSTPTPPMLGLSSGNTLTPPAASAVTNSLRQATSSSEGCLPPGSVSPQPSDRPPLERRSLHFPD